MLLELRIHHAQSRASSKLLPEKNTRSIALVGLAEQSIAYPKQWLDALPSCVTKSTKQQAALSTKKSKFWLWALCRTTRLGMQLDSLVI